MTTNENRLLAREAALAFRAFSTRMFAEGALQVIARGEEEKSRKPVEGAWRAADGSAR